ncbi:hypothetical protein UFOVP1201_26 [uncultured Caudovirales phage]|uniref:Uncharacterized protein n=1 Tax=uncultured Caudovirales phage TaxID=2100421 RepID=A0A6J5NVX5_9CAUD|nr:hypothetical protein UFOVP788_19 [uncultured Caudovirales phage]CAB4189956.1 hypothetical protein UFOVP1201_26 [uncultured Caudovirales phage]
MSHFAEIDSTKKVIRVLVGDNNMPNEGYDWLINNLGGTWIKTSYSGKIRKNFAGIGFTYDDVRDAFIPAKANCHAEETLDEATCQWLCTNAAHDVKPI